MRKLLKPLLIFLGVLIIDQISKYYAVQTHTYWQNQGLMFGLYSELPTIHRGVFLSSLFGLLFAAQLFLLYISPNHLKWPRWGLPILFGGIGSNVTDRIWHGHSIDFIPIPFFDNSLIVFNLADLFQWIGAIILCKAMLDYHRMPLSNRSKILIMPTEQLHIAKNYFLVSICTGLVFAPFGVSYLRATLATGHLSHEVWNQILSTYMLSCIFLILTCGIGSFLTGLIMAHRSAGALYAFERHIRAILAGHDKQELSLRAEDRYQHLIELAKDLKQHIDKKAG